MKPSRSASAALPGDRFRDVVEQRRHLVARLEVALGVERQLAAGRLEVRLVADAGEHVEQRPVRGRREPDAVGGDHRHVERGRQREQRLVVGLLVANQVALQFEADVRPSEDPDQPVDQAAHAVAPAAQRLAPGQRHEPPGLSLELVERQHPLAFRRAEVHPRDEPAEILIALPGFDEDGKTESSG